MKINLASQNCSFKALMIENKPTTDNQRITIKTIKNFFLNEKSYIDMLEDKYTDIYLSANKDKRSVDIKFLTAAGLSYNYIPKDKIGKIKLNVQTPKRNIVSDLNAQKKFFDSVRRKTLKFLIRGYDYLLDYENKQGNEKIAEILENLSMSDIMRNRIQRPDLIPDARVVYGKPAVTAKNSLYF